MSPWPLVFGRLDMEGLAAQLLDKWTPGGSENRPPPILWPDESIRHGCHGIGFHFIRTAAQAHYSATLDLRRTKRDPAAMHAEARQYAAMCNGAVLVEDTVQFGPLRLDAAQIFYASPPNLTLATVNLKPLLPGHVLVFPRRPVQHLSELTDDETLDLWQSVQKIYVLVLAAHGADSAQIGVQDGKHAGQSVPHVHVHILPIVSRAPKKPRLES